MKHARHTEDGGTISASSSQTRSRNLCVGIFEGLDIQSNGATMKVTVTSAEKTEIITREFRL